MWRIYWHWNYTVFDCWIFFCKAFALGSWFTRHFKPQFDWYWKLGLNLLMRKPVTHLLDPKEVGGSLMCPSLSFKKPLQAGDTSQGSAGDLGQGPHLVELTVGMEGPPLVSRSAKMVLRRHQMQVESKMFAYVIIAKIKGKEYLQSVSRNN